jgi:hypothetical protein
MPQLMVRCPNCYRSQPDEGSRSWAYVDWLGRPQGGIVGRGSSCEYCGTSPMPSYAYPRDSCYYPRVIDMVAEGRRRARNATV